MTLFPMTKPRLGLSITGKMMGMAEIHRVWKHPIFQRYHELPISSDSVRPSPIAANLTNLEELRNILRALRQHTSRPRTIALCLPDLCARSTVFRFASLPSSPSEREAIIAGRFQQDCKLSPSNVRIAYRLYHTQEKTVHDTEQTMPVLYVLAVAIQRDIIESYEALCLEAGLVPASISLAGLAVFDLCRAAMDHATQAVSANVPLNKHEAFFLFLADWGFLLLMLRDGHPTFLRVKSLPMWLQPDSLSSETAHVPLEKTDEALTVALSTHTMNLVANELIATIQYYVETVEPRVASDEHPTKASPLFLVGSPLPEQTLPQIGQTIERLLADNRDAVPLLYPIPLHSGTEGLSGTAFSWLRTCSGTALSPFAATVVS
ncbi:MAG: hypothetical protein GKS05_13005 [Nitrospirales bacterium]|nr:hypothetical protein [Nitrospirales bacterium]NKB82773.1 hypothetical protein [Nitrospirales bacterium]